jgi:hypothetical protein
MKKCFTLILASIIVVPLLTAQAPNYRSIASEITAHASTKMQKVRAIYNWICENIEYDTSFQIYHADECYKHRKGVCQAYSELMCSLCQAVGVPCTLVSGVGRYQYGGGPHAWVYADVEKGRILIDPTWGAGYVNGSTFTFRLDHSDWFDVDPYWMIFTHYPDNAEHQFIDQPISRETFNRLPRLEPSCKHFGWKAQTIFTKYLRNEITAFPSFYGEDQAMFLDADIPAQRYLYVGVEYTFKLKVKDPQKIAISTDAEWYTHERWQREGEYSILRLTPTTPGPLSISYQQDDGSYGTVLGYEVLPIVHRPSHSVE